MYLIHDRFRRTDRGIHTEARKPARRGRALSLGIAALAFSVLVPRAVRADSLAFGIPEAPTPAYVQYGNDGFVFTPSTNILVTALDYYISPFLPENGTLLEGHDVGIYDVAGDHVTTLVEAIVGPGSSPVVGDPPGTSEFLSQAVTAVELFAGNSYMLVGTSSESENENGGNPTGAGIAMGDIATDPNLTLNGYYYDYTIGLDYPTTPNSTAYFGPNFEFVATPEPTSALLLLIGIGLMACRSLWRRGR